MNNYRHWGLFLLASLLLTYPSLLPAQQGTWKFVLFGDSLAWDGSEVNTNIAQELASAAVNENPAFMLFTGDCSMSGTAAALQIWTNAMSPLYDAGIKIYPAVGNHDFADLAAYTNIVAAAAPENGPPEEVKTTYAFAYSNALFVVLNDFAPSNIYRINQPWLDAVLATNTLPHVFALGHVPAFRVYHLDGMDSYITNRDIFWNSLSNAHAHVYFCGHDHFYDHSQLDDGDGDPQNDIHQFVVGTGGAPLHPDGSYQGYNSLWTPKRFWHKAQYGYLSVEVAGENVTLTWHERTGTNVYAVGEVFSYSLKARPFLRYSYAEGRLTLTWSGNALLEASSAPDGPFGQVLDASSPYVVPDPAGPGKFYRLREQPAP